MGKKFTDEEINIVILSFCKGINKGPFKHLKESHEENDSVYLLNKYKEDNPDIPTKDISIWRLAVEQAWIDVCRRISGGDQNDIIKSHYWDEINHLFNKDGTKTVQSIIQEAFNGLSAGKKQKIVNMSLKYLFCCKDIRMNTEYSSIFSEYQMPLDSYIMNWYNNIFKNKTVKTKWSNLAQEEYETIQKNIHNICQGTDLIYAEFVIWDKEAKIQRNEDLIQCSNTIKKSINKKQPLHTELESYNKERKNANKKLYDEIDDFTNVLQQNQQ